MMLSPWESKLRPFEGYSWTASPENKGISSSQTFEALRSISQPRSSKDLSQNYGDLKYENKATFAIPLCYYIPQPCIKLIRQLTA